jgi:hypothetical protein
MIYVTYRHAVRYATKKNKVCEQRLVKHRQKHSLTCWFIRFSMESAFALKENIYLCISSINSTDMSTLELEAQKAKLAREILNATDKDGITELMHYFHTLQEPVPNVQQKRKIGILDGKASFTEDGDGKITVEEFLGI